MSSDMYFITVLFLLFLTSNAVDRIGECPTYQNFENNGNTVTFISPNNNLPYRGRLPKSTLKEATLWHNCVNCETALNNQINMELRASYIYALMASHFNRDDVALPGFFAFFDKASREERDHAFDFMNYLNKRGGNLVPQDILKPEASKNWETPMAALKTAFDLESQVYASLRKLHDVAAISEDSHLMDFLESKYFTEQVDALNQLSSYMTTLKRNGCGLGETLFDEQLQKTVQATKEA